MVQIPTQATPVEQHTAPPRLSPLSERLLIVAVTAALLLPCFWQERIQAGDLSSHLYNAWLGLQVKNGSIQGLAVVPVWTNVLCDAALEIIYQYKGVVWAERVVVGSAVLLFFWGAFLLIKVATGRSPWLFGPCLAMLSYGLVFHLGFLNYYVSAAFSFWILALLWRPSLMRLVLAILLAVPALLAHPLPVVWAICILAYLHVSKLVPPRRRFLMLLCAIAALVVVQSVLMSRFVYHWSWSEVTSLVGLSAIFGVDQVWLYGGKYLFVAGGLLLIWCLLLLERFDQGGMLNDPVVHLWLLHAAACTLLPWSILLPQYQHTLAYIPQRISLLEGVFLLVMLGGSRYGRGITRFSALVATVFFTFLYLDDREINSVETEMTALLSTLPPGQRVVGALTSADEGLNGLAHIVDRACIGRCFSYGNYEPATGQFRLRATARNRVVASTMLDVKAIEEGRYTVSSDAAPLYSVCPCTTPDRRMCLRLLKAGDRSCSFSLPLFSLTGN